MNELKERLNKRDVKPTSNRLLVLQYMMQQKAAVSLKTLESVLEGVDKSTLFRTLKTFENAKVIHSIDDGTGTVKYAICLEKCECEPEDLHYHFHCNNCDSTFCLDELSVPKINLPAQFTMKQANLVIKGLCANCNRV